MCDNCRLVISAVNKCMCFMLFSVFTHWCSCVRVCALMCTLKFILFLLFQSLSVSNIIQYLRAYIYYNYCTAHMYNVICTGWINDSF